MLVVLSVVRVICLLIVFLCVWKTTEYFMILPDENKYKPLLAFDVMIMFVVVVYLGIRILGY